MYNLWRFFNIYAHLWHFNFKIMRIKAPLLGHINPFAAMFTSPAIAGCANYFHLHAFPPVLNTF